MINSIEFAQSVNTVSKPDKTSSKTNQTVSQKSVKSDKFECKDPKINLKSALNDGSVVFTEATKLFGFITLRDEFYTYYPQKYETIGDIKRKFGIKDGVISKMNGIRDDDFCPCLNNIDHIDFCIE